MTPTDTRISETDAATAPAGRPTPPTEADVLSLLRSVIDPELGADIVTLGMVPSVHVAADGAVTVGVKLTIGGCPLRGQIKSDVESRVALHPGVTSVAIDWGEMTPEERSEVMTKARWNAREQALIDTDPQRVPPLALPPLPDSAILGSLSGDDFDRVAAEAARTAPPRENGGNQDIKNLTKGTRVFYPVFVPGAKLSMGDLHFSQGDG